MKSFVEKEKCCEEAFKSKGYFWHLCTPGEQSGIIFRNPDDFKFGMNLIASCAFEHRGVKVLAFALMNNHIHFVLCGSRDECLEFFTTYKRKLSRFCVNQRNPIDLATFNVSLIPVKDLNYLRNTIVYVHRNGYVVNDSYTPFSYPWSSGRYLFNDIVASSQKFGDLSVRQKRILCRSRDSFVDDSWTVSDGYISPLSYIDFKYVMSLFRDAHHYFLLSTKNVESYSEIASSIRDKGFLTDEEMFACAQKFCVGMYGTSSLSSIDYTAKVAVANKLHFECGATNSQIRRILRLGASEVNALFPLSSKG